MPRKKAHAQSAMEYLMTYGWSILIIAIVLAALFSLGVFSNSNLGPRAQPNGCRVFRPNGPGTTTNINLEGVCNGELPEYVASLGGASQWISVPSLSGISGSSAVTISGWVEFSSLNPGHNQILFSKDAGCNCILQVYFDYGTGNVHSSFGTGGTWIVDTDTTTNAIASTGTWYYVVSTWASGVGVSTYVNGVLQSVTYGVGSASSTGTLGIPGTNGGIGAFGGGSWLLDGQISNVQIYDTALDSNTVKALYLEGIGAAPIEPQYLVGWWPLDGDTNDYSGNGNNGVPTGVTFTSSWTSAYSMP